MEKKMTKYPFEEKANEFLAFRKGILSEASYKELDRRLRRINRKMIMLKDKGEISTLSPAKMTADDIKAYFLYRKSRKVSASDIEQISEPSTSFCRSTTTLQSGHASRGIPVSSPRGTGLRGSTPFRRRPTAGSSP